LVAQLEAAVLGQVVGVEPRVGRCGAGEWYGGPIPKRPFQFFLQLGSCAGRIDRTTQHPAHEAFMVVADEGLFEPVGRVSLESTET
jgi:hypothetical protein